MTVSPYRIPLRPDYAAAEQRRSEESIRHALRLLAVTAVARQTGNLLPDVAKQLFGREAGDGLIARAAVSPTTTGTAGALAGSSIGDVLAYLRPASASAELFRRAPRVNMDGVTEINLPRWPSGFSNPPWIEENKAYPVVQSTVEPVTLGPVKKLGSITTLTSELSQATGEQAELEIGTALREAASRALDETVFSNLAATSARPAGLLNGVTPITAATGGGPTAAASDIGALAAAVAAGGGGQDIIFIASARQAMALRLYAPAFETVIAPYLPAGTIIAVEVNGIVSGFDGVPQVDIARDATLHYEDTSPAENIGEPGDPNVVASPVRNLYQTAVVGLKVTMKVAYAKRFPAAVQVVTSASW